MPYLKEKLYCSLFQSRLRSKERRLDLVGQGLKAAFQEEAFSIEAVKKQLAKTLFKTGNASLVTFSDTWWQSYIRTVRATSVDYEDRELDLLSKTKLLFKDSLSTDSWLELYRLCLVSGLFVVGVEVRAIAEARVLEEASFPGADSRTLRQALAVSLEHGDAGSASRFLDELAAKGESHERIKHGRWFIRLVCHGVLEALVGDLQAEKDMFSSVHQKKVAVVGPVPTTVASGPEIDSFDLVAKFNYRGGNGGCDPETQGTRVEIAYYNIEQSKYIGRKMSPAFMSGLLFPVYIKEKAFRVLKNTNSRGRMIRNVEWLLFSSEFNAGPNAVYDILRFSPGAVRVFNSDLMLTAGRFKGYWQPGAREVNYCYSFAKTHDPVIQFRFFQSIWEAGVITGDAAFEEVMSLSLKDYIFRLQEAHGSIGRERICPFLGLESAAVH